MRHGFRYTYGQGCRCDDCRAAERRHKAARRKPANDRLPLSPAIIAQLRAELDGTYGDDVPSRTDLHAEVLLLRSTSGDPIASGTPGDSRDAP